MLHRNRMPLRRLAMLMLAAVMLVALISACGKKEEGGAPGSGKGTVIATYKGGEVTETEFSKYTAYAALVSPDKAMYMSIPQLKEQFLKQYIVTKVLTKDVSDEIQKEVDTAVDNFKKQLEDALKTQTDLKKHFDDNDLSVEEAAEFYKTDTAFQGYYATKGDELKPTVTEDEVKAQYEIDFADFNVVSVRHILIGTVDPATQAELKSDEDALKLAEEVKAKLEAGGDWNALAKEFSTDTGSKDKGGLYEKQQAKAWVAEFKEAANTQEIGAIGDPVRSQYGYHVMKVESREKTPYEKLTDADKDGLKTTVATTKLNEFLTSEQDKLEIKVTLPEEPTPSAPASPAASPAASPEASPTASPAAK